MDYDNAMRDLEDFAIPCEAMKWRGMARVCRTAKEAIETLVQENERLKAENVVLERNQWNGKT